MQQKYNYSNCKFQVIIHKWKTIYEVLIPFLQINTKHWTFEMIHLHIFDAIHLICTVNTVQK